MLATADGLGTTAIMKRTGKSKPCVWRWQERFMEEGVAGLLRDKTRKAYRLWRENPRHPGLQFKRVSRSEPIYSARVDDDYRVLGLFEGDTLYWFWVGKHNDYTKLLRTLQ